MIANIIGNIAVDKMAVLFVLMGIVSLVSILAYCFLGNGKFERMAYNTMAIVVALDAMCGMALLLSNASIGVVSTWFVMLGAGASCYLAVRMLGD